MHMSIEDIHFIDALRKFRREHTKYYCFCDVETTGLCPIKNDTISIALIMSDLKHNILDKMYTTIQPVNWNHITKEAEAVHGFSERQLRDFPHPFNECINILKFLAPFRQPYNSPLRFIYHARNPFDWNFIDWLFRKQDMQYSLYKIFDPLNLDSTIKMAKQAGHKKASLDYLANVYNIKLEHHNAESDTLACYQLHKIFTSEINQ